MITLTINGKEQSFEGVSLTLEALMGLLGVALGRVAVARNGEVIPRSQYLLTQLQSGDKIEMVSAIGGG